MSRLFKLSLSTIFLTALSLSLPAHAQMSEHEHMSTTSHDMMNETVIEALAVINSVDLENRKINLSHDPIPEISWPAMTMDFDVMDGVDLGAVEVGAKVTVALARGGDGIYMIQAIKPVDSEHDH